MDGNEAKISVDNADINSKFKNIYILKNIFCQNLHHKVYAGCHLKQ